MSACRHLGVLDGTRRWRFSYRKDAKFAKSFIAKAIAIIEWAKRSKKGHQSGRDGLHVVSCFLSNDGIPVGGAP